MKLKRFPGVGSSDRPALLPVWILTAVGFGAPTLAQQAGPATATRSAPDSQNESELGEITVTAQRRKENLQNVPITVEAFSEAQLAATGVVSTADLPMVTPGLVFGQQAGLAQPFLRGVGSVAVSPGLENPVAIYVDDVYYGPVLGAVMSFANVSQVEVDKGPQGTLFGRNAIGGLIQVRTKDPTQEFNGSAAVTLGNYRTVGTDVYVAGGVTSTLATDLAFHYEDHGQGYGRNIITGTDVNKVHDIAARNKWLFAPSSDTEVKLILDYDRSNIVNSFTSAPGSKPIGAPVFTGDKQDIANFYDPGGVLTQWGASIHVKQDLGVAEFLSITAFRRSRLDCVCGGTLATDPDEEDAAKLHEIHHQFSQEFQFSSPEGSSIAWATGAYFFGALSAWQPTSVVGSFVYPFSYFDLASDQRTVSGALYGQGTFEIASATHLTVGARYTYERHSIVVGESAAGLPGFEAESFSIRDNPDPISFKKLTWRLSLDHRFTPDLMAYISYNRGFKSGGFDDIALPTSRFLPEQLDAYEIGTKATLLDDRIQVNPSAFLYNYKNMQNAIFFANSELIYNSASSKLYGLDLDTRFAVTRNLAVTSSVEWLHAYYASFANANFSTPLPGGGTSYSTDPPVGAKGHHLPLAPDATFTIGADYTVATAVGDIVFNVTDSYNSGWFGEPDNRLHQGSYNLVNARASWTSTDKTDIVTFWGRNLTNLDYLTAVGSAPDGDFAAYGSPRTFGVTLTKKF